MLFFDGREHRPSALDLSLRRFVLTEIPLFVNHNFLVVLQ